MPEFKKIKIDCPVCEQETTITAKDVRLAVQHKASTGGLVLVSCSECCRALRLLKDIPEDSSDFQEWIANAAEDPEEWCPCLPMLDPEQEKIPAGGYADLGVFFYRPGGGGPALKKRPYMFAYGINPECHLQKNPSMGGEAFKVGF